MPTQKSKHPGASWFSEANPFAIIGAMRLEGTSTPVPSRMRDVFTAAAPQQFSF
jgi:hypothetical protein